MYQKLKEQQRLLKYDPNIKVAERIVTNAVDGDLGARPYDVLQEPSTAHHVGPCCSTRARPSNLISRQHCQLIGVEHPNGLSNLATIVSICVPSSASIHDHLGFTRLL